MWSIGCFGSEVAGFLPHHLLLKLRTSLFVVGQAGLLPSLALSVVLLVELLIPGEVPYVVCSVVGVVLGTMRIRRRSRAARTAERHPSTITVRLRQIVLLATLAVMVALLCRRLATVGPDVRQAMGQLALRMFVVPLLIVFVLVNLPWLWISRRERPDDTTNAR